MLEFTQLNTPGVQRVKIHYKVWCVVASCCCLCNYGKILPDMSLIFLNVVRFTLRIKFVEKWPFRNGWCLFDSLYKTYVAGQEESGCVINST